MPLDDIGTTALICTAANRPATLISAGLIIVLSGLAIGCGSGPEADQPTGEPAQTQTAPPPSGEPAAEAPSAPEGAEAASVGGIQGKDVLCSTPSQTGQITWQAGQAQLSVTQKPNQPVLEQASPVAIQAGDDDSVTYGYLQDRTAYIKTFPNGNCLVQVLDAQGNVTVEEYGRTS